MDEAKYIRLVESLIDFSNAVEAACVNLRKQIEGKQKVSQRNTWDPDKIKWTLAQGSKGPYDRSEDVNSLEFKAMLKDLAAHQGKLRRDGLFYWTFKNGAVVGRKRKAGCNR